MTSRDCKESVLKGSRDLWPVSMTEACSDVNCAAK